jgi:hypothetical protein
VNDREPVKIVNAVVAQLCVDFGAAESQQSFKRCLSSPGSGILDFCQSLSVGPVRSKESPFMVS